MMGRLLNNHVLANLTFVLVMAMGAMTYLSLPRQQDPTINFNWIVIIVALPGASAEDVEKQITDPLETKLQRLADVDFVNSTSRENVANVLVRFNDISPRLFDKRLADLQREVDAAQAEFPAEAAEPTILEITTSSAFPAASLALVGLGNDEALRAEGRLIQKTLERWERVGRVDTMGLNDPELRVGFNPAQLEALGLAPSVIADSVRQFFSDLSAGEVSLGNQGWLVRLVGKKDDPEVLANIPIMGSNAELRVGDVAEVFRTREDAAQLVSYDGKPAIFLGVSKKENANTLTLVEELTAFVAERNPSLAPQGLEWVVLDDQTTPTRTALSIMQNNALIGLLLVFVVAWLFLGSRIALLTAIGIPFILMGTFWVLGGLGQTLNVTVLLGVVISLGMLVDDAVVVVESIYYRIERGMQALDASLEALKEVAAPVTTAVLTTIAAFLPLMLLPGILGKFMMVIPLVVCVALLLSLVEAFWMLPAHVVAAKVGQGRPSRVQAVRVRATRKIRLGYAKFLGKALRYPWLTAVLVIALIASSIGLLASGRLKVNFFASDTIRLFYVNVDMPVGTPLEDTLRTVERVEQQLLGVLDEGDARSVVSYSGQQFTDTEALLGSHLGQIMVSLLPQSPDMRSVEALIDEARPLVQRVSGPEAVDFLRLAGGPPTASPVSIKVKGDDFDAIGRAAGAVKAMLDQVEGVQDIRDDAGLGRLELVLNFDALAVARSGLTPAQLQREIRLLVDGEVVAGVQSAGETVEVRVKAEPFLQRDISELLNFRLANAQGQLVPLSTLVEAEKRPGFSSIRHYNFRRAITVEADIDDALTDTVTANQAVIDGWDAIRSEHPGIELDFSGELDDIEESLGSIGILFLFGLGLMYLILGTQFRSYSQPLIILVTVPLAFTGVLLGLLVTGNPLSLYTLYGVVALSGIAVNSAIVLISAANARLTGGMSPVHATLYAARRRVVPILVTTLTTIAGLFSLATGLGGASLIWGPVATAIVFGLGFSTTLTLFVVPLLYLASARRQKRKLEKLKVAHN